MEFKIDRSKDSFIEFFSKRTNTYTKPHVSIWAKPKLEFVIDNRILQTNPNPSGIFPRNINKFIYHTSVGISFQMKKIFISFLKFFFAMRKLRYLFIFFIQGMVPWIEVLYQPTSHTHMLCCPFCLPSLYWKRMCAICCIFPSYLPKRFL